jgi:hypothetical protein
MQAYYEIEAQIPLNHHLSLQLPDSIPVGIAKIAVIYDLPEKTEHKSTAMAKLARACRRRGVKSYGN